MIKKLNLFVVFLLAVIPIYGYQVDPLPPGNLIVNPWFRDFEDPIHAGLSGWIVDDQWGCSQKRQNPAPDPISSEKCGWQPYCGTASRLKDTRGQCGKLASVGVPSSIYQVVAADSEVTRYSFGAWWVALRMEIAEILVYGSDSADGPWELLWTPFTYSHLGGIGAPNYRYAHTGYLEEEFTEGHSYYLIEIYGVLADESNGVKITGIYFAPASGQCNGSTELCADGVDNDCDGQVDCEDSDCSTDPACTEPPPECLDVGAICVVHSDCCTRKCVRGICSDTWGVNRTSRMMSK